MLNGLPERLQISFLLLHLTHEGEVARTHLRPCILLVIRQNLSCLMHQLVSLLQGRPECCGGL